jgi:hypothetical protein
VAWAVKVTDEYAAWFTALIEQDRDSATPGGSGRGRAPRRGPDVGSAAGGPAQGYEDPPSQRAAARIQGTVGDQDHLCLRPHPVSAAAPRRRQGGQLGTLVPRNIPLAEQLYTDYTADEEE